MEETNIIDLEGGKLNTIFWESNLVTYIKDLNSINIPYILFFLKT